MNIPTLDNYRTWDNTEAIQLTSHKTAGDVTKSLPLAKRRAPTFKELTASGGVYTSQDLVWLLPKKIVDAAGADRPKPSDVIIDGDGVRWTILEAPLNTLRSTYRCTARDIILAADLRDTLTIKRPTATTTDNAGGRAYSYASIYTSIACRFQEANAAIGNERGQRVTVKSYSVWVERRLYLTIEDQIVDGDGTIYEMKGWQDADRIDQLQRIDCERKG